MEKLRMFVIIGALAAVVLLSVAGLGFSEDYQPVTVPDGPAMSNTTGVAPAPLQAHSVPAAM